jgi:hypothetical protein
MQAAQSQAVASIEQGDTQRKLLAFSCSPEFPRPPCFPIFPRIPGLPGCPSMPIVPVLAERLAEPFAYPLLTLCLPLSFPFA